MFNNATIKVLTRKVLMIKVLLLENTKTNLTQANRTLLFRAILAMPYTCGGLSGRHSALFLIFRTLRAFLLRTFFIRTFFVAPVQTKEKISIPWAFRKLKSIAFLLLDSALRVSFIFILGCGCMLTMNL